MAISTQYGQSADYFGHADYEAAKRQGRSASEILSYLIANPGKLRGSNVSGGGGLYDEVLAATAQESRQQANQQSQMLEQQQRDFQQRISQQQTQFQTQLAAQQQEAQEAQRQLMIQMQRPDRAPAEVRMARGGDKQEQLRRRGTTGYFGRQGLRIGSLNVPTPGMSISSGAGMQPTSGSFV